MGDVLVEERRRDHGLTERRPAFRLFERALETEPHLLSGRELHRDRRAEREVVLLCELRRREEAVHAQPRRHGVGPDLPIQADDPRRISVDGVDVMNRAEELC